MSLQPVVAVPAEPIIPGRDRGRIRGWIHEANRYPIIPGIIMLAMVIAAAFAPQVAPHDPQFGYLGDRETPPFWHPEGSFTHLLGTDQQGRDMLSRVIFGARISMLIVVTVVAIGGTTGTALGIIAAWYGRHIDEVIMRAVDVTLAMPFILVALVAVVVFTQSTTLVIGLLAIFSWNGFARQIQGRFAQDQDCRLRCVVPGIRRIHDMDHVEAHLPGRRQYDGRSCHSKGRLPDPGRSHI